MGNNELTISQIFLIGREYYPEGHFRVEIWDDGLRFFWESIKNGVQMKKTSFFQRKLSDITEGSVRGFLDAETQPDD
ncbi:hypothetical protein [Enterobacter sp. DE0047]|uniref:hypothetical protein n=1 Tax=Enterobacter sp. DE0047 TaxID=2584949 RepID=UPI0011A8A62A|nr:hypothetical protein [Enterobacter sp. DE0047]